MIFLEIFEFFFKVGFVLELGRNSKIGRRHARYTGLWRIHTNHHGATLVLGAANKLNPQSATVILKLGDLC